MDYINVKFEDDERSAMRAYLQRAETRLSTLHRVGGGFLSGSGLLIFFPVFTRDTFLELLNIVVNGGNYSYYVLILSVIITFGLQLYALYLLFMDITKFYFTAHQPGHNDDKFHPRFTLSGIALSPDELLDNKKSVLMCQLSRNKIINFILPFNEEDKNYFASKLKNIPGIIPETRRINGDNKGNSLITEEMKQSLINDSYEDNYEHQIDLFHVAFGICGVSDRKLIEEVAKMEASLVRHIFYLRTIILRYVKAFIMSIWTSISLSLVVELYDKCPKGTNESNPFSPLIVSLGLFLWASVLPILVRMPIDWIYDLGSRNKSKHGFVRDAHLSGFERTVVRLSLLVLFLSNLSFIILSNSSVATNRNFFGFILCIGLLVFVTLLVKWKHLLYVNDPINEVVQKPKATHF
ncbi:hypothetical protein H1S01_02970 [Heliobacterium chlorum]|uniref:Uncharacterized protein n=1 Tax=Heliobacterium chlorum TaxID=2698 RepID=A0ABR7T0H8_HELCL|nr:hypothetical protein [Heliobacterium chlorum]MBC9783473.1 hypothetical protein [Heliobacterium chlorum]